MTTLIFKTSRDIQSYNDATIVSFVKEGSFAEAMNHFGDRFPVFNNDNGDFIWNNGQVICTAEDLANKTELRADVDSGLVANYYTKNSDSLGFDELMAITEDAPYMADGYWEENGFTVESFNMAKSEGELADLYAMGSDEYMSFRYDN